MLIDLRDSSIQLKLNVYKVVKSSQVDTSQAEPEIFELKSQK